MCIRHSTMTRSSRDDDRAGSSHPPVATRPAHSPSSRTRTTWPSRSPSRRGLRTSDCTPTRRVCARDIFSRVQLCRPLPLLETLLRVRVPHVADRLPAAIRLLLPDAEELALL